MTRCYWRRSQGSTHGRPASPSGAIRVQGGKCDRKKVSRRRKKSAAVTGSGSPLWQVFADVFHQAKLLQLLGHRIGVLVRHGVADLLQEQLGEAAARAAQLLAKGDGGEGSARV